MKQLASPLTKWREPWSECTQDSHSDPDYVSRPRRERRGRGQRVRLRKKTSNL